MQWFKAQGKAVEISLLIVSHDTFKASERQAGNVVPKCQNAFCFLLVGSAAAVCIFVF